MNLTKAQFLQVATRLRKSSFLGNFTKLLSGEIFAQTIGLASIPLLTRLYGPEAFGVLGVFMAVSEIAGNMSTLRYDVAVVLPKEDKEAWALLRFSGTLSVVFALVLLLCTYPFRSDIAGFLGAEDLMHYFPVIALMIVGVGWQSLANFWAMRGKHFKAIAQGSAGASVLGNSFKLGAGLFGYGAIGLLLGTVVQRWSKLLILCFLAPSFSWRQSTEKSEMKRQVAAYRDFPKYRLPQDTLSSLTRVLPNVLLASFFGPVAAGFYILATRIIQLPFTLLQEAVRKVFYVKAIETGREGHSLFRLCFRMTLLIAAGMLPVAFVVVSWGGFLFEWAFGSEWATSGRYAKWIIFAVLFSFCSVPASIVIPVIGWNRFYLIFEILTTVFRISIIVLVAMFYTADLTVVAIALTSAVSSLLFIGILMHGLRSVDAVPSDESV